MDHAQLQREVIKRACDLGLHVHDCGMLRSEPGFPDLVIIGRLGVKWRELKVPPDKPTREQKLLGYVLTMSGQDWGVWTPDDLASGQIDKELETLGADRKL